MTARRPRAGGVPVDGTAHRARTHRTLTLAEALLTTGLVREATAVLRPAVACRLPEALLLAARCALRAGDHDTARALASDAEALFREHDRSSWAPAARAVALRAGAPGRPTAVAEACDRHGHHDDAADLRLTHAPDQAAARRHRGTDRSRAIGWLARARLSTTRRDAVAACRAGLALHDPDTHGDLVDIALDHALSSRDARSAWRWSECRRTPATTPETACAGAELRLARARADHVRVALLEREIRRLSRTTTVQRAAPLTDVVDALRDRALLVFLSHRGRLVAVSVAAGRVRLHDFGEAATTARHVRALSLATAPQAVAELDRLLRPAGDRPLVVVPSPELARVPWAGLPSARGRAVSVAPSATCWFRADQRPLAVADRLWVAGPDLRHARYEVDVLRRRHGGRYRSTVDETLHCMLDADVLHVAAHGVHEDEMFSHLDLDDGPLHGHDFAALPRVPAVVVLSACASGLAGVLLRRGARVVVESVRAVPDDRRVVDLMVDLHANLDRPAQALADAQAKHGDLGFVCVGAG
ncbi:CHAT domain-containing protein [Saccharothrix longispora]|uniref:CHAT domain-containing protein n=1 Tax=Saccharothrix longispora TaxID=33920 RepID=UPI0028FDC113|nr:CHAT domain-containing protein [Saccharothrix longispora]MDU0290711.1 CHAT domain-containing protein [Saccharothrix longispora]